MKSIFITVCILLGATGSIQVCNAQTAMLRGDVAVTKSRFLGVDMKDMKDNSSWAAGLLVEYGSGDFHQHYRWHTGARVRHLQASRDMYYYDTLSQLVVGLESYQYNYIEVPLGAEFDFLAGVENNLNIGCSADIFGAIPFGVKGVREYQDANPWSKDYETPYFILGFALSGYIGINFEPFGLKFHYMGQFPFIPVVKPAPSTYTGPDYNPQLLGTRGLMVSLFYVITE